MAPVIAVDAGGPAAWLPVAGRPPSIGQCLLLAALLHLLLVALLGSAPGGSAHPGQGVWGAINVRLTGNGRSTDATQATPPPEAGPAGLATAPRRGGAVRTAPAAPEPAPVDPGAARLGRWSPAPTTRTAEPLPALSTPAPGPPLPAPAAQEPPAPATAARTVPAIPELRATDEADEPTPAAPLPASPAPLPPLPTLAPAPELAPLPRPPIERRMPAAPAALPLAAPLPHVPPIEMPSLAPSAAPPLQPLPAPRPEPAAAPTAAPAAQRVPDARSIAPAAPAAPVEPLARPAFGGPDAGAAVGHDVATAPGTAASAPRLNLDPARPRGGEISSRGSPGVLKLLPHPAERAGRLGEEIQKSARPDCRNAYSGMGVLAVLPLAADAVRTDGCRW